MRALVFLLVSLPWITYASARQRREIIRDSHYIIACRTTDYECFKRQYRSLRDHFLLGNTQYAIEDYRPYTFKNSVTKACVQLSGLEESELAGIQLDSIAKELTLTLEMPFRIQQVANDTAHCLMLDGNDDADDERNDAETRHGPHAMKRFVGNATIQVIYPFRLKRKKGQVYLSLGDENLDVVLDIPDLSQHEHGSAMERKLYELSEWAYTVVQNVDASQYFALPYTTKLRLLTEYIPLLKLINMYPDEEYVTLNFKYSNLYQRCNGWKEASQISQPIPDNVMREFPGKS